MNNKKHIETYLDYLYKKDYKERPVSVEQFLCDDRYFGKLTKGGKTVYPIWKEKMNDFLNEDSRYLLVLTGAIGVGKTRVAVWSVGYVMYKMLCLRNAWQFFNIAAGGKMAIAFFNMTKALSESRAFGILQQHLLSSEWFVERGVITGRKLNKRLDFPLFDYVLSSPYSSGFGTQGHDICLAIMDEVDSPTVSEKQKRRVLQAYESTVRRFESRFVDDVYKETLGKFFLVASKQEQHSFLDAFITQHKNDKNTYVADIKYWETKEKGTYCGKTFPVMLGDVYMPPKILSRKEEIINAQKNGYQILDVPVEFYNDFERDLVGGLRDIAGVSTAGLRKSKLFPSEKMILDCYDDTKQDPVNCSTIVVGLQDDLELIKFLDLSKIRVPKYFKRFIHCDIAYSGDGDAVSLAMSCVKDWVRKNVEKPDGTFEERSVPVIETDFIMRFKSRPGDEVPLYRIRKLILDLRGMGYNIEYTSDLALLSADTKQILSRAGIPCDYLSLDRDITPYLTFKELVSEQRWICHRCNMLHFELANLEYDKDKQKIDHPDMVETLEFLENGGTKELVVSGSKDMSDAAAGSAYKAVESAPSVPVTTHTVKSVASVIRTPAVKNEHDWVLGKNEHKRGPEQYLLQSPDGKYWTWTRENAQVTPSLRGPFTERILNMPVTLVENPAKFSPSNTGIVEVAENRIKLDILKIAGRK